MRALGPPYERVVAAESGLVDVLTQHERPAGVDGGDAGEQERQEKEYEDMLLGMEVSCTRDPIEHWL